jgi:hypothetical protein
MGIVDDKREVSIYCAYVHSEGWPMTKLTQQRNAADWGDREIFLRMVVQAFTAKEPLQSRFRKRHWPQR